MGENDHRVLPGDMVTFENLLATDVLIVKTEQQKARNYDNSRDMWRMASDEEKNRLADLLETSKAVSGRMFYLVIAASKNRAFLLRSDTLQRVVALVNDVRVVLRTPT